MHIDFLVRIMGVTEEFEVENKIRVDKIKSHLFRWQDQFKGIAMKRDSKYLKSLYIKIAIFGMCFEIRVERV